MKLNFDETMIVNNFIELFPNASLSDLKQELKSSIVDTEDVEMNEILQNLHNKFDNVKAHEFSVLLKNAPLLADVMYELK